MILEHLNARHWSYYLGLRFSSCATIVKFCLLLLGGGEVGILGKGIFWSASYKLVS